MCLDELAKNDKRWREIAFKICGNKHDADELVQNMYVRRYDNDRENVWNEYYVTMVLRSIYLNDKVTKKMIPREVIYLGTTDDKFEPDDYEYELLEKAKHLTFNQRELLELTYDYSLRGIQARFGVNYLFAYRTTKKAREILLNGDLEKYNNKRLKYRNMEKNDDAYYEGLDKRSREYKTWVAGRNSVGLGDTVEKITEATGVKKVVQFISKVVDKDCGCEERKKKLNAFFRYKEKLPKCLIQSQIDDYGSFVNTRSMRLLGNGRAMGKLSIDEVNFVCEMYSEVFGRKLWKPTCSTCAGSVKSLIAMIYKIDTVYYNTI